MLEPWIIEQIRRREEEERRRNERPQLEIPANDERGEREANDAARGNEPNACRRLAGPGRPQR